jgi:hypothetical protein
MPAIPRCLQQWSSRAGGDAPHRVAAETRVCAAGCAGYRRDHVTRRTAGGAGRARSAHRTAHAATRAATSPEDEKRSRLICPASSIWDSAALILRMGCDGKSQEKCSIHDSYLWGECALFLNFRQEILSSSSTFLKPSKCVVDEKVRH